MIFTKVVSDVEKWEWDFEIDKDGNFKTLYSFRKLELTSVSKKWVTMEHNNEASGFASDAGLPPVRQTKLIQDCANEYMNNLQNSIGTIHEYLARHPYKRKS